MIFGSERYFLGSREITGVKWLLRAAASMYENVMFLLTEYQGAA